MTHSCSTPGCGHPSHGTMGLAPVRMPAPIPAQQLPETAALAIQAVRARLAALDGRPLRPAAPIMFLRIVPDLGDGHRTLSIEHLAARFDPDLPRTRGTLTALLRGATGLDVVPTRSGASWRWDIGIEARLDPAVALTLWRVAAELDGVASASVSGYTSDGMWTIENGLENGSFRILRAGPVT